MGGAISIPTPWTQQDPQVVELAGVRDDLPVSYSDGCHINDYQARKPVDCAYGDPQGTRTAVLYGDSHAAQWLPALDRYARDRGWRLEYHTKAACSPVLLPFWERTLKRDYDECFEWRDAVMRRIAKGDPDIVFVGSSRDYEIEDGASGRPDTRDPARLAAGPGRRPGRRCARRPPRVVLLAETPFLTYDPLDCLADPTVSGCDPPRSRVVDDAYAAVEAAAALAAGATVLSANDLLCPGATCPVVVDGTVVFRDQHHVTATYMARLAEPIANLLEGRAPYPSPSPSAALADASARTAAPSGMLTADRSAEPATEPATELATAPAAMPGAEASAEPSTRPTGD